MECAWKSIPFKDIEMGKQIGGGGVGVIYAGTYQNESVALKTLFDPRVDEALKQEYMDELLVMSQLHHPNIVAIIGACMAPPNLCIVMELCVMSLYDLLHQSSNPISVKDRVDMAVDIAKAMQYLHGLKPAIIHRDLKSHNLLIHQDGTIKLCDFGLVRTKVTTAGTPCYMPKELLLGQTFSKSVDVYMFGMVLWEIFAREIPFHGYDVCDIKRKVVAGEMPAIPTMDCPPYCQELIKRCWQNEANQRPSFNTIVVELSECQKDLPQYSEIESADYMHGDALDGLLG